MFSRFVATLQMGSLCRNLQLCLKEKKHYHINDKMNESSQDKLKHIIEGFQDHYMISLNEGNLYSLLIVISALGVSFLPIG